MTDLVAVRAVLHNLSEWDFDFNGRYRMDEKEAKVCLEALKATERMLVAKYDLSVSKKDEEGEEEM